MEFFGVPLSRATRGELVFTCLAALGATAGSPGLAVATPNPEILLKARADRAYAETLSAADIRLPDGIGLYLAAQLAEPGLPKWARFALVPWYAARVLFSRGALYRKYGERLAGSDLTAACLAEASRRGLSVAVAEPEVADIRTEGDRRKRERQARMPDILRAKYPGVRKWTVLFPDYAAKLAADPHDLAICTAGAPRQERAALDIVRAGGAKLALAVGGSLDFECGFVRRAPGFVRALGAEWLWRLALEPRKRAKRIFDAAVRFPLAALRNAR